MPGKFVMGRDVVREAADWGSVGWLCRPSITGAANLAIVEATFGPGKGHAFHKHPEQEEVIFIVAGEVEQWIGEDKRNLRPGELRLHPRGCRSCNLRHRGRRGQDPGDLRPGRRRGLDHRRDGPPATLEHVAGRSLTGCRGPAILGYGPAWRRRIRSTIQVTKAMMTGAASAVATLGSSLSCS